MHRNNCQWIRGLSVQTETIQVLEENITEFYFNFGVRKVYDSSPDAM